MRSPLITWKSLEKYQPITYLFNGYNHIKMLGNKFIILPINIEVGEELREAEILIPFETYLVALKEHSVKKKKKMVDGVTKITLQKVKNGYCEILDITPLE